MHANSAILMNKEFNGISKWKSDSRKLFSFEHGSPKYDYRQVTFTFCCFVASNFVRMWYGTHYSSRNFTCPRNELALQSNQVIVDIIFTLL